MHLYIEKIHVVGKTGYYLTEVLPSLLI